MGHRVRTSAVVGTVLAVRVKLNHDIVIDLALVVLFRNGKSEWESSAALFKRGSSGVFDHSLSWWLLISALLVAAPTLHGVLQCACC